MKKTIFLIFIVISLFYAVSASASFETGLQADGKAFVSGYSGKSNTLVTIIVYDDYRKYYISQCTTDSDGFFRFDFFVPSDKKYNGRIRIGDEQSSFELSSKGTDEQGYAYMTVKGYNGSTILSKTKVSFSKGDSVLDITKRVLDDNNISYSAAKDYIKSINGLSEFDHGAKSGWMYMINGEFPDVGASSVTVKSGDDIQWLYTSDMGNDLEGYSSKNKDEIIKAIEKNSKLLKDKNDQAERLEIIENIIEVFSKNYASMGKKDDAEKLLKYIDSINSLIFSEISSTDSRNKKRLYADTIRLEQYIKKLANRKCDQSDYEKMAYSMCSIIDTQEQIIAMSEEIVNYEYMIYDSIQYAYEINIMLNKNIVSKLKDTADGLLNKAIEKHNTVYLNYQLSQEDSKIIQAAASQVDVFKALEYSIIKQEYCKNRFMQYGANIGRRMLVLAFKDNPQNGFVMDIDYNTLERLTKLKYEEVCIYSPTLKLILKTDFANTDFIGKYASENPGKAIKLLISSEENAYGKSIKADVFYGSERINKLAKPFLISIRYNNIDIEIDKTSLMGLSEDKQEERLNYEYDDKENMIKFYTDKSGEFIIKSFQNIFTDLDDYTELKDKCEVMAAKGFINGKEQNKFFPEEYVTKAEFVSLLCRVIELKDENTYRCTLKDVHEGKWYYKAAASACEKGLIKGNEKGLFYPEKNITRKEAALILSDALDGYNITLFDEDIGLEEFRDKDDIGDWAYEAVRTISNLDIMSSDENGRFNPSDDITRGDVCNIMYKFYKAINEK